MAKVTIDSNKCKGCTLCIAVCPRQCLAISRDFNKAGYRPALFIEGKNCTGCGFCYQTCPDVCIEVYK